MDRRWSKAIATRWGIQIIHSDFYAETDGAEGTKTLLQELQYYKLKHRTDQQHQLWQEGSHPEMIETEAMMWQKIEYIHNNPVRRGYVDDPIHWRYSSARWPDEATGDGCRLAVKRSFEAVSQWQSRTNERRSLEDSAFPGRAWERAYPQFPGIEEVGP